MALGSCFVELFFDILLGQRITERLTKTLDPPKTLVEMKIHYIFSETL